MDDSELLKAWELAYDKPPFLRTLVLLEAANRGISFDSLLSMPIGQRDSQLLSLRKGLFGSKMETVADCDSCGETLEFGFTTDDVLQNVDWLAQTHSLKIGKTNISYRLPNSHDLVAIAQLPTAKQTETLVRNCIVNQESATALDRDGLNKVANAIAQSDPQSDIQIDLNCASCEGSFSVRFDIGSFFWAEVNAWAEKLLAEIHTLAKVYHWTENETLKLGSWRRQVYLNMVRQ